MAKLVSKLLIAFVRIYQMTLSRVIGNHCRFYPSCSQYMIDAIRKKGPLRGVALGAWRIMRCHPFNPGGYDPVR